MHADTLYACMPPYINSLKSCCTYSLPVPITQQVVHTIHTHSQDQVSPSFEVLALVRTSEACSPNWLKVPQLQFYLAEHQHTQLSSCPESAWWHNWATQGGGRQLLNQALTATICSTPCLPLAFGQPLLFEPGVCVEGADADGVE